MNGKCDYTFKQMATLFLAIYLKLRIQKTSSMLITQTIPLPPPVVKCFARGHFGESIIVTSLILKVLHHSFGTKGYHQFFT